MCSQPPLNTIVPRLPRLPQPIALSNGAMLHVIPVEGNDLVSISVMFHGGQWTQAKRLQSDFTMRQLRSGIENMAANALDERLDFYGATVTAGASGTFAFVKLTSLKRTLADVLPLFAEIIAAPAFEQERLDLAIEEGIMTNDIAMQRVQEACKRLFAKQLMGPQHPMAQHPEMADYEALTRTDLVDYHAKHIHLGNATLYATGSITDDVISMIDSTLGALPSRGETCCGCLMKAERHTPQSMRASTTIAVPSLQSSLRVGKKMPPLAHADTPAIKFISTVLGGYFGSRLMSNIRERLGLTYGIGTCIANALHDSIFLIATETPRDEVDRCVAEITGDIRRLQREPIGDDEMAQVKNYMLGQFCRTAEANYSLAATLMNLHGTGRTFSDMLHTQQRILSLTAEDVMQAATQHFSTDGMLVAVADGA